MFAPLVEGKTEIKHAQQQAYYSEYLRNMRDTEVPPIKKLDLSRMSPLMEDYYQDNEFTSPLVSKKTLVEHRTTRLLSNQGSFDHLLKEYRYLKDKQK